MIAYISQQGAKVIKQGRRILVQSEDATYTFFSWELEQVLIFGNVTVTQPALSLLLQEKIDVAFFRLDGRFIGRFAQEEPKNVFLRKKQFLMTDNKEFCLKVAKAIVRGKLLNQATLLNRIKRAKNCKEAGVLASIIKHYAYESSLCKDINILRGIEGHAAAQYFKGLSLGFSHEWSFAKRVRRPPTDPVNAVLSLCYTLLINRMYASVRQALLDPYPGVLHSLEYGRHSLPLDLVEEFRPLIADTLTLSLFNLKVLGKDAFEVQIDEEVEAEDPMEQALKDPMGMINLDTNNLANIADVHVSSARVQPQKQAILLCPESYKKVLTAFSRKLDTKFFHPIEGKEMTYSEAMTAQARQYRKILEGEKEEYQPLLLR